MCVYTEASQDVSLSLTHTHTGGSAHSGSKRDLLGSKRDLHTHTHTHTHRWKCTWWEQKRPTREQKRPTHTHIHTHTQVEVHIVGAEETY